MARLLFFSFSLRQMVFTDARNGFKKDHLHCRWSFLYLKMGFQKTTFIAAGLFQASKKTTSIATGLCGANKWIPQRPPLLLLVFFKPVNGHLKDHRSRVEKHPAAASGGTGPRRETHPALVLKPLGRPLEQAQSGPCGTYTRTLTRAWDLPAIAASRHVRHGRMRGRIGEGKKGDNAPVRAAAIIFPRE